MLRLQELWLGSDPEQKQTQIYLGNLQSNKLRKVFNTPEKAKQKGMSAIKVYQEVV